MERWSEAAWDPANRRGGTFVSCPPKGVLHTTEGSSYAGAKGAYTASGSWPHATLSFEGGRFRAWQHYDLDTAARALQHPLNTCETNRANAIQVEIVGSADPVYARRFNLLYVEDFPDEYLDGIARWMRYVERVMHMPSTAPYRFGRPGYVARLICGQWIPCTGWVGHCHVPNNNHTDPGAIDISTLLAITPAPPQEDEDMAMIVLDAAGPDDQGRDSCWEADAAGNVYNWNGARPIRGLADRGASVSPGHKIVAAVADPSGNGVILVADDQHQEPNGHWVRSTYKLLVGE